MKSFAELHEALNMNQRIKRQKNFIRNRSKVQRGRAIKQRRLATNDSLKTRSARSARNIFTRKITGGIDKSKLPIGRRHSIEKILDKRKSAIKRLALRLLPNVRKKELERLVRFRQHGVAD